MNKSTTTKSLPSTAITSKREATARLNELEAAMELFRDKLVINGTIVGVKSHDVNAYWNKRRNFLIKKGAKGKL